MPEVLAVTSAAMRHTWSTACIRALQWDEVCVFIITRHKSSALSQDVVGRSCCSLPASSRPVDGVGVLSVSLPPIRRGTRCSALLGGARRRGLCRAVVLGASRVISGRQAVFLSPLARWELPFK